MQRERCEISFFSAAQHRRRRSAFLERMKILVFSFVLLVLNNKNLSLKNCVVFFSLLLLGLLHHCSKLSVIIYT